MKKLLFRYAAIPLQIRGAVRLVLAAVPAVHIMLALNWPLWLFLAVYLVGFTVLDVISSFWLPLAPVEDTVFTVASLVVFARRGYCGIWPPLYWVAVAAGALSLALFIATYISVKRRYRRQ